MTKSFIEQFEVPTLQELMDMYVYRSGGAVYDNILRNEMEAFKAAAPDLQLDFTKALEAIESEIQGGATSVQRTVVIPVDIETNIDVQIDYVLDINHKINISVNQTLTATYEQDVCVEFGEIAWEDDPITNFSKSFNLPDDGDSYRLALFDNDELTSFRRREGFDPSFADLEAVEGEGSVALSPEVFEGNGQRETFTITDVDRLMVDSFGKGGSDYALYNETDDLFGSFEGFAGTGRNITFVVPDPLA